MATCFSSRWPSVSARRSPSNDARTDDRPRGSFARLLQVGGKFAEYHKVLFANQPELVDTVTADILPPGVFNVVTGLYRATAGTIFQDTRKPLVDWFRAMYWVTTQKNGASALGLQRVLGLGSYKPAWTWLHKLRRAMVRPGRDCLAGAIEVDETYVGSPEEGKRGRQTETKAIVAVAAEKSGRGIGRIHPAHEVMPRVHNVASLPKRWLIGTHQGGIQHQQIDYYLDEFTFRFNRRRSQARGLLFHRFAQQAVAVAPAPYHMIIGTARAEKAR